MSYKIGKITFFLLLLFSVPSIAQSDDDAEKQRKEFEVKAEEDIDERMQTFVSELEVDDFQKEIIKQKFQSYYIERKKIYLDASLKYFQRDEKLRSLTETHFASIKNLLTDDTMEKIQSFALDGGQKLMKEKKKKKRKNKKKKD